MSERDTQRFVCTKANPWTPEKARRADHPDATFQRDNDYGNMNYDAEYHCPNCGLTFEVELPN